MEEADSGVLSRVIEEEREWRNYSSFRAVVERDLFETQRIDDLLDTVDSCPLDSD